MTKGYYLKAHRSFGVYEILSTFLSEESRSKCTVLAYQKLKYFKNDIFLEIFSKEMILIFVQTFLYSSYKIYDIVVRSCNICGCNSFSVLGNELNEITELRYRRRNLHSL